MDRIVSSPYYGSCDVYQYINRDIRDEFKLIYHFIDPRFNPPIKIPFNKIDFEFNYFVEGRPEIYTAKKKGELSQNCVLYSSDSSAKVIFENHGLKPGILKCEMIIYTYDSDMSDRFLTSSDTVDTGIKLIG